MHGIKARACHEFAPNHPHPGIDEIEPADITCDLGTLAPHAFAHCDRGDHRVVQMDVDAQQPTAVRPGTGKRHGGIHESRDRHAHFARNAEQERKLRGRSVAGTTKRTDRGEPATSLHRCARCRYARSACERPAAALTSSGRSSSSFQKRLLTLSGSMREARNASLPIDDRFAVHQCIAGTRVPDLAVDRQQQAGVIDLDGPSAHARCFSGAPACA